MLGLFSNRRSQLGRNIDYELAIMRGVKFYCCLYVKMVKYDADGNIKDRGTPTFRSKAQVVLPPAQNSHSREGVLNIPPDELNAFIDAAYFKISASLDAFKAKGSGWVLDEIIHLEQIILKYRPLRGECSGFKIPECLSRKRCLLNVIGRPANSTDCFLWSVLAGLHTTSDVVGEIHWTEFSQHRNQIRFEPKARALDHVSVEEIEPLEESNDMSIHVFGWENDVLFPLFISKRVNLTGVAMLISCCCRAI